MKRIIKTGLATAAVLLFPLAVFAQETAVATSGGSMKQTIINAILAAVGALAVALIGNLGRLLGKLLNKKIGDIDNVALQNAAYVAVRFVEDKFEDLTGSEKFEKACKQVANKIPGVSGVDIEEAVRAMFVNFKAEIPKNV